MNSRNFITIRISQIIKFFVLSLTVSLLSVHLQAQISHGGEPASFQMQQFDTQGISYSPKIPFSMTKNEIVEKQCTAYEFGKVLPFGKSLRDPDFGTRIIDNNGNTIWKATITSENALALGLYFSDFYLPKGAKLFIYSPDKEQIIGSFTDLNNPETGLFATELIYGDKLIIEYNEPASVAGLGHFTIDEVSHAYRGISDIEVNGFGTSGSCEVNVNCPEGANYENQKNSVVRLNIKKGGSNYWCTGSVVNNSNNDRKPYVLSAWHCFDGVTDTDLSLMIVYFNYQSATCDDPTIEPVSGTMTGATKIATSYISTIGSDFYLALLKQNIPEEYNAYFMGWDRSGSVSNSGVSIHHPSGDIKKISTYNSSLASTTYSYPGTLTNGAWEVIWSVTANGHGVTEGGSSGSPIYSQNGYLIGTLTGGDASCSDLTGPDYYGKFNFHWDKNGTTSASQLKPWLDPSNTGITTLSGFPVGIEEFAEISDGFFMLYPNPSNGEITLWFNDSAFGKTFNIRVSNMLGQPVYSDKLDVFYHLDIDLQHLRKGMYFIEMEGENQRQIQKINIQ